MVAFQVSARKCHTLRSSCAQSQRCTRTLSSCSAKGLFAWHQRQYTNQMNEDLRVRALQLQQESITLGYGDGNSDWARRKNHHMFHTC